MNELKIKNIDDVQLAVSEKALQKKAELLAEANVIGTVKTEAEMEMAISMLWRIAKALKAVETSREIVKHPVIALGRKIDRIAREYVAELESEKKRIAEEATFFEIEKRKQLEAKEKERYDTVTTLVLTRDGADKKKLAEIDAKLAKLSAPIKTKTDGTKLRETWDFEVVDVYALFDYDRQLVRLEPNRGRIAEMLERRDGKIPGVHAWQKTKLIV